MTNKTIKQLLSEAFLGYSPGFSGETYNKKEGANERYALHVRLADHYKATDPTNMHAVGRYTATSRHINGHLHDRFGTNEHGFDHTIHGEFSDRIPGIDSHLKAHKAPEDFHVYTGLTSRPFHTPNEKKKVSVFNAAARPSNVKRETKGKTDEGFHKAVLPAYTSTTITPHIAEGFSGVEHKKRSDGKYEQHEHYLKIHIPKGSNHGAYIGHYSNHDEQEFLMRRGTKLHIDPSPERVTSHLDGHKTVKHIWHAKVAGNHYDDDHNT